MQVVTASSRGQIVIPKEIRKRLNIVAGKRLSVKAEKDQVLLTPLPDDSALNLKNGVLGFHTVATSLPSLGQF